MIDLRDIVHRLGGDIYAGGRAASVPGPGHSKRDRSLSLRLSDDGARVLFHSFADDPPRAVLAHLGIEAGRMNDVQTRSELARLRREREAEHRREERAARDFCAGVWGGTVPIEGTAAEGYLWSRALIIESPDVRFHPAAPRTRDPTRDISPAPAMVALSRSKDGAPAGIHVTYVRPDGTGKAFGQRSRLMFGHVAESAVRLGIIGADRVLAVGEGIETSAAYASLKGVPAWAALSTSNLKALHPPPGLKKLIIAADPDPGGMRAAERLAERAHRVCDVVIDAAPDGQDWADVWSAANV